MNDEKVKLVINDLDVSNVFQLLKDHQIPHRGLGGDNPTTCYTYVSKQDLPRVWDVLKQNGYSEAK
jgi:hypothetical protein